MDFDKIINYLPALLNGAFITISLTLISAIFGIILGLFLALGRISNIKLIERFCWFYIWIFRGTPLLMQIMFIYYAIPLMIKMLFPQIESSFNLPQWPAAILALSLNVAAYFAESIRAGIQSIDSGQMEAAKALGMNYWQSMRRIIIPQAYRRLIPPIGNELIALSKDTSLVSAISMVDLMYTTTQISSHEMLPFIFIPSGILYLAMTTIFTVVFEKLEKKYSKYEKTSA